MLKNSQVTVNKGGGSALLPFMGRLK